MSTIGRYRSLLHHLHRAALLSERVADRELADVVGIGRTQFLILRTIDETPATATTQQRLADHLGLTKAAVSRHVLTAERNGWLTVSTARSRREHAVGLTAAGRDLVARGRTVQRAAERRAARTIGAAELEQCAATLATMCDLLAERLQEPDPERVSR